MSVAGIGRIWRREALLTGVWLAGGTLVGLLVGQVLLFFVAALCGYLLLQLVYTYQLHRWLSSDRIEPSDGIGVWQEIYTELYRLKQRNRRRKKRLKSIVNEFQASTAALPDGAVVLDSQGRIAWFNTAGAALLALRSPQDLGQRVANLIRHPRFADYLANPGSGELEIPSSVSEDATLLLRIIPYGNDQRLLIARDVSEQKRLEATRRDFVANASHELRTPLTVLRGYLEMMEDEAREAGNLGSWQAPITEMGEQARRMNRIIDSLLKLAHLESEGLQQRQEQLEIPEMLHSAVQEIQHAADAGGHKFALDVNDELMLFGRSNEIESIFVNLLSNAVRYTPAGGRIEVSWRLDERGACLAVTDNGPGIEAQHIPRLTERFYRVDAGRRSGAGGTGLGLAIVKHCLEHHEAELEIESSPGEGSTFTCRFPSQRTLGRRAA